MIHIGFRAIGKVKVLQWMVTPLSIITKPVLSRLLARSRTRWWTISSISKMQRTGQLLARKTVSGESSQRMKESGLSSPSSLTLGVWMNGHSAPSIAWRTLDCPLSRWMRRKKLISTDLLTERQLRRLRREEKSLDSRGSTGWIETASSTTRPGSDSTANHLSTSWRANSRGRL